MAKPVIVSTERGMFMLVLPATHQVSLALAAQVLGVEHIRLAHEAEFAPLFPDCEVGAMPALGNLYGFPVYVDEALTQDPEITFPAGSHRVTVTIAYRDFARMVEPRVARFALPHA
jgi:Ala-tRNA(Pro) deacylase